MSDVSLFGFTEKRLEDLRSFASNFNYSYDFGKRFQTVKDDLSDVIIEYEKSLNGNTEDLCKIFEKRLIPVGPIGACTEITVVIESILNFYSILDSDLSFEALLFEELIKPGLINRRIDDDVSLTYQFPKTCEFLMLSLLWKWAEIMAIHYRHVIPHCNGKMILRYPEIVRFLVKNGFRFVEIRVDFFEDYCEKIVNKHGGIRSVYWDFSMANGIDSGFSVMCKDFLKFKQLCSKYRKFFKGVIKYDENPASMINDLIFISKYG